MLQNMLQTEQFNASSDKECYYHIKRIFCRQQKMSLYTYDSILEDRSRET